MRLGYKLVSITSAAGGWSVEHTIPLNARDPNVGNISISIQNTATATVRLDATLSKLDGSETVMWHPITATATTSSKNTTSKLGLIAHPVSALRIRALTAAKSVTVRIRETY